MTSRERVYSTLDRKGPDRAARQLWLLPWAQMNHPEELARIERDFESDFTTVDPGFSKIAPTSGEQYKVGEYVDEWGCRFSNAVDGIHGQAKRPLVSGELWEDVDAVHIPEEWLSISKEKINLACAGTDKFVMAGCNPRPFEQLQFIRTSELLYVDFADPPRKLIDFMERMHDFYCRLVTAWAETDVDAISFMDDWGSQRSLLIDPRMWARMFKPMYRDYIDIAHKHGKKAFMHSDGYTLAILPELIELGLDAVNAQIFCIGIDKLRQFRGKITFWGELDRQKLLPHGTLGEIDEAVRSVYTALWDNGGCIAQCEFGAGANPENVYQCFKSWDAVTGKG